MEDKIAEPAGKDVLGREVTELYDVLQLISSKYRNGSAHTKALPFTYLEEFYNLLIGKEKDGFLFKLLDALKR